LGLWIWPCGASADSDKDHAAVLDGHERLEVLEAYSLPMREVSGLALAQDEGGVDIYAVGDASYDLGRLRAEGPPRSVGIQVRDVADLASTEPTTVLRPSRRMALWGSARWPRPRVEWPVSAAT
jgi:hypothetical protein